MLKIRNLEVGSGQKTIIKKINLLIKKGEIHFLLGPNGAGKSTLGLAIMGHPDLNIKQGEIRFKNKNINKKTTDERARMGIFLAFQQPVGFEGVKLLEFLRTSLNKTSLLKIDAHTATTRETLVSNLTKLDMDKEFVDRFLNWGFSGGEKRKSEVLQLLILKPQLIILDEIDSGLDIDSLRYVTRALSRLKRESNASFLVITHHSRIAQFLKPDFVHIMTQGEIIKSAGKKLIGHIEKYGYKNI
ncbi:MAG: Fe-S cluster assembly ATP-binding protein SufC [Parcubacteria group bacterium GW2011_GWC1_38_6]|nr:MAG: Fe-S cluster assembly ATP-binding protein SufC [Parcubacteria group bacterium GW2011_GWC1_38_6]